MPPFTWLTAYYTNNRDSVGNIFFLILLESDFTKSCVHKCGTTKRAMHLKGRSKDLNNGSAAVLQQMQPESEEDMLVCFIA